MMKINAKLGWENEPETVEEVYRCSARVVARERAGDLILRVKWEFEESSVFNPPG